MAETEFGCSHCRGRGFGGVGLYFVNREPEEPTYQGRKLSEWLGVYNETSCEFMEKEMESRDAPNLIENPTLDFALPLLP